MERRYWHAKVDVLLSHTRRCVGNSRLGSKPRELIRDRERKLLRAERKKENDDKEKKPKV